MSEVDSNLNYLLGRLSLVTQEFNQIKGGLLGALDSIRSSLRVVQNEIQGLLVPNAHLSRFFNESLLSDVGPGPHRIENEEEPDFSLLPQRDAPAASA